MRNKDRHQLSFSKSRSVPPSSHRQKHSSFLFGLPPGRGAPSSVRSRRVCACLQGSTSILPLLHINYPNTLALRLRTPSAPFLPSTATSAHHISHQPLPAFLGFRAYLEGGQKRRKYNVNKRERGPKPMLTSQGRRPRAGEDMRFHSPREGRIKYRNSFWCLHLPRLRKKSLTAKSKST
jgi:hypothetical protein